MQLVARADQQELSSLRASWANQRPHREAWLRKMEADEARLSQQEKAISQHEARVCEAREIHGSSKTEVPRELNQRLNALAEERSTLQDALLISRQWSRTRAPSALA